MIEKIVKNHNEIDLSLSRETKIKYICTSCGMISSYRIFYFRKNKDLVCKSCKQKMFYNKLKEIDISSFDDIKKYNISVNTIIHYKCEKCNNRVYSKRAHFNYTENKLVCTACHTYKNIGKRNSLYSKKDGWTCKGCEFIFKNRKEYNEHHKHCILRIEKTKKRKSLTLSKLNKTRIENGESLFKGHSYIYCGIEFDSSWELAFWIFMKNNNVNIEKNTKSYKYIYKEKEYLYYPDFIINNKIYEIKGDMFLKENFNGYGKWQAKLNQVVKKEKIIVLYQKNIKNILKYINSNYSKNYLKQFKQ